jgi:hypothetical protein
MNLKAKYNVFMAEHPLLRGCAWLITKLFMLTLVAVLFVLEIIFRVIGNASKEKAKEDEYPVVGDMDKAAKDLGYMDYHHWQRMMDDE